VVAIAPFRAVRYDPTKVDLPHVTSPPNDVIEPDEATAHLAANAESFLRVILPAEQDGDAEYPGSPNKYERAREQILAWLESGTLQRDATPALYPYTIRHDQGTMRGFFCRLKLDPTYTSIRRHEKTLGKKKRDRLNLTETTGCNTESIWMLYRDERGWVDEILTSNAFEELLRFTDHDGMEHRVWRVDRPEAVGEVIAQFDDRTVVIADGHHRYQTALEHHAATGKDTDDSLLVCMVRDTDPGLRIEPTHRLVFGLKFDDLHTAISRAQEHWDIVGHLDLPGDSAAAGAQCRAIVDADPQACIILAEDQAVHLKLKDGHKVDLGRGRLDDLVVVQVHEQLLEPWGVQADHIEDHIHYTRTAGEAIQSAREGRVPFVVMLKGEEVDSVLDVASEGHVMPQKSTFFVPKLRSGLVMGPLDEPSPVPWNQLANDDRI
jgi:uncharacterized protein (DUF1015 family)